MNKSRFFFLMAALSAVVLSCVQKEQEWEVPVPQPDPEPGYVYRFSLAENETKATMNDHGVFWENDDPVGLFLGAGAPIQTSVDASTTPKTVVFSTQQPLQEGTWVYTCYPYQAGSFSADNAQVTFPSEQTGGSHSAMPMAGIPFQTQAGDMQGVVRFQNLGSVIDFRICSEAYAGEQVRSITLTVTSGTNPVSGTATMDLTKLNPAVEETMTVTWPQNASVASSVTLNQIGTATIAKDVSAALGNLYMVVAPGTYSGTISVVTNAATYTFPFTGKTFARNALKRFNLNLANATRTAYYTRVQQASDLVSGGTYLIAYLSSATEAKLFHPVWNGYQTGWNNSITVNYSGNVVSVGLTDQGILSTPETDNCQVSLEQASGSSYYLKAVGEVCNYICLSNESLISGKTALTLSFDGSGVRFSGVYQSSWPYSNSYTCYIVYNDSNGFGSSTSNPASLALFKLEGIPLSAQDLQFSAYSFTYSLADNPLPVTDVAGAPTLSGAQTQVVYSSSNPQVAAVDVSTGALTIQGEGQAWITATAAASETYAGAKISYRLDVTTDRVFRLESEQMAAYLDYTEAHPYDPTDYTYSYVESYSSSTSQYNRLDLPRPAIVEWTNPASGNTTKTVDIYNDAAHSSKEMTVSVGSSATSAEVYSLIPGRRYWYVVSNGGSVLTEGTFSTSGRRRIMKVGSNPTFGNQYANNCRDLGGMVTTDGRRLRYGKIFRGTNMDKTSDEQKAYLLNYMHIGLDLDLRQANDKKNPLNVDTSGSDYNSIADLTTVSKMSVTISDVLTAVHAGRGVYIHCKVGADRTAYVCLLLELLLGVRQELCDEDYELTSFCAAVDDIVRKRGYKGKSYYYYPLGIEFLSGKSGTTLQEKAYNYVKNELNISEQRITQFRTEMLEPQN